MAGKKGEAAVDDLVHWEMRLGNWIWKRGGRGKDMQLACLFLCPALVFLNETYSTSKLFLNPQILKSTLSHEP